MACPSGSRTVTAFRNPALPSGSSTVPVETKADRLFRGLCAASSTLIPKKFGLPVDEVVGLLLWRKWTPVARRQVFKKLNARTRGRPERGDAQAGAEDIVEAFLLRTVVLTLSCYFHPSRSR